MNMKKHGQVAIYLVFIILALFVVMITAFFAPMGVLFNTEMYKAGEKIMLQANESISSIQNDTARNKIQNIIGGGLANTQNNIEVNNAIFEYGWVLIIMLIGLVLFLFTRRVVEVGGGQGLV